MDEVSSRIKKRRRELKMTQTELATVANLTAAAISQFESGSRNPSFKTLLSLSNALKVSVDYLMGKAEELNNDLLADSRIKTMFKGLMEFTEKDKYALHRFYEFLKNNSELPTLIQQANMNDETRQNNKDFNSVEPKTYESLVRQVSCLYMDSVNINELSYEQICSSVDPHSVCSFVKAIKHKTFQSLIWVADFDEMTLSQSVESVDNLVDRFIADVTQVVLKDKAYRPLSSDKSDKSNEIDALLKLLL